MKNFNEWRKEKQLLNEISPELLDRAARKSDYLSDTDAEDGNYHAQRAGSFKRGAERRRYDSWNDQYRNAVLRNVVMVSENLKDLIFRKDSTPDEKDKARKMYQLTDNFFAALESIAKR